MDGAIKSLVVAVIVSMSVSGCFLDRSGTRLGDGADSSIGFDADRADAASDGTDAGNGGADASLDASRPGDDGGPLPGLDSGFDSGFDSGLDSGFDSGFDAGQPSCDSLYGAAVGYVLCVSTPTECEFYTIEDDVRSCDSTCETFGGTCLRRWREDGDQVCRHRDRRSRNCDALDNEDDICVCTRP